MAQGGSGIYPPAAMPTYNAFLWGLFLFLIAAFPRAGHPSKQMVHLVGGRQSLFLPGRTSCPQSAPLSQEKIFPVGQSGCVYRTIIYVPQS